MKELPKRIKELINKAVEFITPYVQKLSKWFKVGFVAHLAVELLVVVIMLML